MNRVGEDVALFVIRCTHHEKTEVSKFMKFQLLSRSILNMFLVCYAHLLLQKTAATNALKRFRWKFVDDVMLAIRNKKL